MGGAGSTEVNSGGTLMSDLYIIKIGGNIIDDPGKLESFLDNFARLEGAKILIHGGGKLATRMAQDLGIESRMIEGRRVTDAESLKIVTMVYAGLINKNIVAGLQALGCNSIGLTGADANLIEARKRPVKFLNSGEEVDYGFVGDMDSKSVNTSAIKLLIDSGLSPVFSAITHDGNGQLLNTNADTIASALSVALSSYYQTSLVYCFEKDGVLRDVNDESSVIPEIGPALYSKLKSAGLIFEGMIPKLDNAFAAIGEGVKEVFIGNAKDLSKLKSSHFGTRLSNHE